MCTERRFDITTQVYNRSGQYEVQQLCNSLRVTNTGNDAATVDGIILYPGTIGSVQGDGFTIGGNAGEIYAKRSIVILFAGVGLLPAIEVTQKYYTP